MAPAAVTAVTGADKDKATEDGRTPLFIAAESNHPSVAVMLLEAGADKDRATDDGRTPLQLGG